MILLAEHDEPSLAAKKKQQHVALKTAASTPKNRVWNFFGSAHGQIRSESDLSAETATGSVQFSYETASGQAYYYTSDQLGSTRELVDGSGNLLTRYSYDPYGKVTTTYLSGTHDATKQYALLYAHQTSGLDFSVNRIYENGRWLSRDLIGISGGINLYSYTLNDPVDGNDPLGLCGNFLLVPSSRSDSTPVMTTNPNTSNLVSGPGYEVRFYDQGCCPNGKITLVQTIDGRMDGSGPLPDAIAQSASSGTPDANGNGHYWFWDSPSNGETLPIFRHSMEVCAICTCNGKPTIIGCVTFKWRAYNSVFNTGSLNKTGPSEPQPASSNFHKKSGL